MLTAAKATPPEDLAILKEYRAAEVRVLAEAETPREHIANALQILDVSWIGSRSSSVVYYDVGTRDAIRARLAAALEQIDAERPIIETLTARVAELAR